MKSNETTKTNLKTATLNANGLKNNQIYINELVSKNNIVCIQESWHLSYEDIKNNILVSEKKFFHVCAQKSDNLGRPSGGLIYVVDKKIKCSAYFPSARVGVLFIHNVALINVYLPYYNANLIMEFECEINLLSNLIRKLIEDNYKIIVTGDFNCDLTNINENTTKLIKMMNSFNLFPYDILGKNRYSFTFFKFVTGKMKTSWPDHVYSLANSKTVSNVMIQELGNNFGDHLAIEFDISIFSYKEVGTVFNKSTKKLKAKWLNNKSIELYSAYVNTKLKEHEYLLSLIIECETETKEVIENRLTQLHELIKEILLEATNKFINMPYNKNKRKYWWDSNMQKYHVMVCTAYKSYITSNSIEYKLRYYEAKKLFRKQKKLNEKLKSTKNLEKIEKLFKKDQDGFWVALKKISRKDNTINIPMKDLQDHYSNLFNSHNNIDEDQMLLDDEKFKIKALEITKEIYDYQFTISDINNILCGLPNGKSPGYSTLTYENYKFCSSNMLSEALTLLYNTMIKFTIIPKNFNISTIKPLIKDEKKPHEVLNTRPVAVSEPDNNIFERLMLNLILKDYKEQDEQFGFKEKSSCAHAIFMVTQMLKVCNVRKKPCYICALDASKAFDKVVRNKLWLKMIENGIRHCVVLLISKYYDDLNMIVVNGTNSSEFFKTKNGVKQGGVVSPKLYNIYGAMLIIVIKKINCGINLKDKMVSIIVYADDVLLITDDQEKMANMLKIIGKQGNKDDISFNAKKSIIITNAYAKTDGIQFVLNNSSIPFGLEMKYLGFTLNTTNTKAHTNTRVSKTLSAFNKIRIAGLIQKDLAPETRAHLFNTYIRPITHFGLENCDLDANDVKKLASTESTILKSSMSINKQCHHTSLMRSVGIKSFIECLILNKLNFYKRLLENEYTRTIIGELKTISIDDFSKKINNFLNIEENYSDNISLVNELIEDKTKTIVTNFKKTCRDDPLVTELKRCFKIKNGEEYIKSIRSVIGY